MTLRERAIVETYTGKCMLTGDDRDEVYKYMAEIMGRPVYSHELADKRIQKELQARSLNDFVGLCRPPQTQADRIRSMTDEELSKIIKHPECKKIECEYIGSCNDCVLEWLKRAVEEYRNTGDDLK